MVDQLLVRLYNVGLGDCIYLRIPDVEGRHVHVLIDCGNKFGSEHDLARAIEHLKGELPTVPGGDGQKKLDLLVVTHAHEDHVRGLAKGAFSGIQVEQAWLSAGMDPQHPQAEKTRMLHTRALTTLMELTHSTSAGLANWAADMLSLSKAEALDYLLGDDFSGRRVFVHAGAELPQLFQHSRIRFHVLAPEQDIDHYYLGRATGFDLEELSRPANAAGPPLVEPAVISGSADARPEHISREDFARLRAGMARRALSFVLEEGTLVNNTSVVLLLEWHGRRLLFTGDAEVSTAQKGAYRQDKRNGSWNTMWKNKRQFLAEPLDFLKVGHHGSHNATPWKAGYPLINEILDVLLPEPTPSTAAKAYAAVSTARTNGYPTIPDPELLGELGKRICNSRYDYVEAPDMGHFVAAGVPQPPRTDLEQSEGNRVPYLEFSFSP